MNDDRKVPVVIGGKQYDLCLTTRATKEISARFGGLENLGEKLMNGSFEIALTEYVWLIVLLANQSILMHNITHPDDIQPLLTEEAVEVLTSPAELTELKDAVGKAFSLGLKRNIESEKTESEEETLKNLEVG